MTQARANELYGIYRAYGFGGNMLDLVTPEERKEINEVWDQLPGYTCFLDAFFTLMTPEKVPPYQRPRNEILRSTLV